MPAKLLIADDHDLFRSGLIRTLVGSRYDIVAEAKTGDEAVDKALMYRPDVVVMDVHMPQMNGIEATRAIKAQLPTAGVVILSATDDDEELFGAIEAGASAYVVKDDSTGMLTQALSSAMEGKAFLPPLIAKRVMAAGGRSSKECRRLSRAGGVPLSSREIHVLRLMAEGKRNRQIATELGISERTVGNHINNVLNKLRVNDRAQAIVYAVKAGIVRP